MDGLRETLIEERRKAAAMARSLEPNPGSGEDTLTGPGAYYRGTVYGLTVALYNLPRDAAEEGTDG